MKEGDKVIKSEAETVKAAVDGVKKAGDILSEAIQKQIQGAEESRKNWGETNKELQSGLDGVKDKIDTINNTPLNPTATFRVDSAAVDAKINELNNTVTHSTHVIHVQQVQENSVGGMIRKFADGGWNRLSGQLPGYGGGDRVRALLEDGEFIMRKEAVRKYGAALFYALNNLKFDIPKLFSASIPEIPKTAYAAGGMVSGGADLGRLTLQAGSAELPVLVQGENPKEMVRNFERELEKMRLTRA